MTKYLAVAAAAARRCLAERWVLLGRTVFMGVILFTFSRIWQVIGARDSLPGVGRCELLWYLALTEWVVLSTPQLFQTIENEVRSGDFACRLVRPIDYVGAQVSEAIGEALLRMAVLAPAGALYAFAFGGGLPADPRGLLLALPLALLGALLAILFMALIGLSAFWVVDTFPCFLVWQKLVFLLGGLLFPLEIYPDWLQRIAHWTPFPLICWAPGRMALGFQPALAAESAFASTLWLLALVGALVWVSSLARARLTVNGG
jgi:viologen exporter family transport system permease protein